MLHAMRKFLKKCLQAKAGCDTDACPVAQFTERLRHQVQQRNTEKKRACEGQQIIDEIWRHLPEYQRNTAAGESQHKYDCQINIDHLLCVVGTKVTNKCNYVANNYFFCD